MKRSNKILALLLSLAIIICAVAAVPVSAAGDTVYVKVSSSYGTPNCYMWNSSSDQNAGWPGVKMTDEGDGVYSYTPDKAYSKVIFNNGSSQTGDLSYPGANSIYLLDSDKWETYDPTAAEPVVTISKKDGSSFKTDTVTVTVTAKYADSAYYTVDGGAQVSFTDTADVTLGADTQIGSTVTLLVSASNKNGSVSSTATYTKKDPSASSDSTATTSKPLDGYFSTNPNGQVGKNTAISIDGSISDWDSSMLIAQGTANDDPRVYRPNSMYEVGIDLYALYAAYDSTNLYLMWEMTNVQDVVAPNDDYPLSQGTLWQTQELPFFIAVDTGDSDTAVGNKGGLAEGGTIWDSGMTFENGFNKLISINTKGGNGPWVYGGDEEGLNPVEILDASTSDIEMNFGKGILSKNVYGINGAYGEHNGRVPGDVVDETADWVDFNTKGHKSASMDFFYEMSIPLDELEISVNDIETSGIGVMLVATMGKSPMDCLPGDLVMTDQAHLDDEAASQVHNSFEKSDEDNITVPFARVGKLLSGSTGGNDPSTPTTPTTPSEPTEPTTPAESEPASSTPAEESTAPTQAPPAVVLLKGDADCDGVVNIRDATAIQKHVADIITLTEQGMANAEVDGNGILNVKDATFIQKSIAGIPTALL